MQTTIIRASQELNKNIVEDFAIIQIKIETKKELKTLLKKFELENGESYPILNTIPEHSIYRKLKVLEKHYKK